MYIFGIDCVGIHMLKKEEDVAPSAAHAFFRPSAKEPSQKKDARGHFSPFFATFFPISIYTENNLLFSTFFSSLPLFRQGEKTSPFRVPLFSCLKQCYFLSRDLFRKIKNKNEIQMTILENNCETRQGRAYLKA